MKPKLLIVGAGGFDRVTLEHDSRQLVQQSMAWR